LYMASRKNVILRSPRSGRLEGCGPGRLEGIGV
jgi:hypothetical protein